MVLRFSYEAIVGVIGLISVIAFGNSGIAFLALLAPLPIFLRLRKIKLDEREKQVFYKAGNYTLGFLLIIAFLIYYYKSNMQINGYKIADLWIALIVASLVMLHGVIGLFFYKRN